VRHGWGAAEVWMCGERLGEVDAEMLATLVDVLAEANALLGPVG
jgi:hypothetical protein